MGAGQGVEFIGVELWADEYDPDCPTELLMEVAGPQENTNNATP